MTRVLMVCLGNICRSPLAEGILRSKTIGDDIFVDSAGTGAYHVGEQPDPRSIAIGKLNGVDISGQKARKFVKGDFDAFDIIYVMDRSNYENVIALATNEEEIAKVSLILNEVFPNEDLDVPDPYYGGDFGFKNVFNMLDKSCEIIANKIRSNG